MKNQKIVFIKASLAFMCCVTTCGILNIITLASLGEYAIHDTKHCVLHFFVYLIQGITSIVCVDYGYRLWCARKTNGKYIYWYHTREKTPDMVVNQKETKVIFITVDGCLFNGTYHADNKKFYGYDGLDFPVEEIYAWAVQGMSMTVNRSKDQ